MPRPRTAMRKIREVLRLHLGEGLSPRQVAASALLERDHGLVEGGGRIRSELVSEDPAIPASSQEQATETSGPTPAGSPPRKRAAAQVVTVP